MELGVLCTRDHYRGLSIARGLLPTQQVALRDQLHARIHILAKTCMIDTAFKGIQSSAVAAAILFVARTECAITPVWCDELSQLTFHDPKQSKSTSKALSLLLVTLDVKEENNEKNVNLENDKENNRPLTTRIDSLSSSSRICEEDEDEDEKELPEELDTLLLLGHTLTPSKEEAQMKKESALTLTSPVAVATDKTHCEISPTTVFNIDAL
jgi:hypothetical protein